MKYHPTKKHFYIIQREKMKKPTSINLGLASEGFMMACKARRLSVHTIADYNNTIKKFIGYVGDLPMRDVTTSLVARFLASLPHSAKTVLNYHVGLAAFWTWALKEEYVDRHIIRLVDKPRPKKVVIKPFVLTEVLALLNALRNNRLRDRTIIYLLLDTGMRASELIGIMREDIDLVGRKIKVIGKGNKERFIPFSPKTASVLLKYLSSLTDNKIFPITRTGLRLLMLRLGKRASIPGCYPHRFRHTFAINYLRNGGDPYTLQEILGHTTMDMVRRYLHIAEVDLERAHRKASPVENWNL